MSQQTNMSDPFSGSQGSLASPYKRKYEPPVKKAQLWAPSYIRMCALSCAIPSTILKEFKEYMLKVTPIPSVDGSTSTGPIGATFLECRLYQ